MVYYMSMEFLMGRALGNNLINLKAYKQVKEALEEMGLNLDVIEDQEPDPALGETVDWVVLLPALWNPSQHWAMQSIWLWNPLPLRNVQTEDQRWFSG